MLGQNVPPCLIGTGCGDTCGEDIALDIDITDEREDSDPEDHCGNNCDCVCCAQVMSFFNYLSSTDNTLADYDALNSQYSFQYSFLFQEGVWHPPSA